CQGIFPALTSTLAPSSQSASGCPTAQATSERYRHRRTADPNPTATEKQPANPNSHPQTTPKNAPQTSAFLAIFSAYCTAVAALFTFPDGVLGKDPAGSTTTANGRISTASRTRPAISFANRFSSTASPASFDSTTTANRSRRLPA